MKLSDELKTWGYHSSISKKGKEQHMEMSEKAEQLEAEIALKADYIERLEVENAVLIKRLWDYEHQASDERIRDEK